MLEAHKTSLQRGILITILLSSAAFFAATRAELTLWAAICFAVLATAFLLMVIIP
jgi:hypothetical protein